MPLNVVLYQPEIPANTGNIGRLCIGANARLHLIKPMRFFLTDKYIKRAGLDYWDKLDLQLHDSWEAFLKFSASKRKLYFTTKSDKKYSSFNFQSNDFFIFGPESRGIPENILKKNRDNALTIPMSNKIRSLNLSNSVAVVVYEAIRQMECL